jgi:kinesin family protein 2/24
MEETRPTKTLIFAHISPLICDASHSANTLSYAAPFRIIPKRRQPAPFDAEDPRTWDNASTIKWLTVAFTKQQEVRRQAVWNRQQAEALKDGKKLHPLPALPHERRNLISFEKLCPKPYGGAYLARLYGANWVQECLQNRSFTAKQSR